MDCAADCCIECYSTIELFQIWLEVTVEFSVRIISFGLKFGPTGIVVVLGVGFGIYVTLYDSGRAKAVSGNTIKIGKERYRLYGIAALAPGQTLTWGSGLTISGFTYCKDALTAKIGRRKVRCKILRNVDGGYDRTAAICSISLGFARGREDLGRWMVRNGYAVADIEFADKYPINDKTYADKLLKEQEFAEKHRLGIHAGKFINPRPYAKDFFRDKWKQKGGVGEPPFGSLKELEVAFELEWQYGGLFEVTGKVFGGEDVSELALTAVVS